MFNSVQRLHHHEDIENLKRDGSRYYHGYGLLWWMPVDRDICRVTIVIGKKFSKSAVRRNRQKRILRSALKKVLAEYNVVSCDILFSYVNKGKMISFEEACYFFTAFFKKNNLIK